MEAFDYRKKGKLEDNSANGGYAFAPRDIESIHNPTEMDSQFDTLFEKLALCTTDSQRNSLVSLMGTIVGEYIKSEADAIPDGKLDITGEVRGLAAMQGLLERELIKRGPSVSMFFRDPNFLGAVNAEADFAHAEKINEKLRGAESVHSFVEDISKMDKVLFIGSEINLDTRHAIDLVIGMSDDPKVENPEIDEVSIVQVKTGIPSQEEIDKIIFKHASYAEALKQLQNHGVGEKNQEHRKEDGSFDVDKYTESVSAMDAFYRKLAKLAPKIEPTWESFSKAAIDMDCDPVLMFIRVKSLNENKMNALLLFQKAVLNMLKDKAESINVPQDKFSNYSRAKRGITHISGAKRVTSIIVAGGKVISKKKLLE